MVLASVSYAGAEETLPAPQPKPVIKVVARSATPVVAAPAAYRVAENQSETYRNLQRRGCVNMLCPRFVILGVAY